MAKQELNEVEFFIKSLLSGASDEEVDQMVEFESDAVLFSTWYLAVRDQASKSPRSSPVFAGKVVEGSGFWVG